jgi:CRP/FNR family transcriptional regulator
VLQKADFFRGLSRESCRRLAELARPVSVKKRQTLFVEGAEGDAVYILSKGSIQLSKAGKDGNEVVIRTVKPGDVFAEVILFEENRYPVTATAVTPAELFAFHRFDVLRLFDLPEFRRDFVASLMRKQRYLAERVRYLTSYDVEQRFFVFLEEQYGAATEIDMNLSKKDIASAIGATPETFSRLIRRLSREGTIRWEGKSLVLKERPD